MFIIVTYHFFAHFPENNINGFKIFSNSKWGIIGVALFFMISGASLYCNYGEKIDLKKYFKKRFLGIFPMFWIAYFVIYLMLFFQTKTVPFGDLANYKYLVSIVGMDGYLGFYINTFYLIGEWFLGCIILIYILFPIYRLLINKYPKIFFAISSIIGFGLMLFLKGTKMPVHMNLLVNSYSFILGMYIFKYIKEIKWWQMLIALAIPVGLYCIPAVAVNYVVTIANCIAYCLFIVLAYVGMKINNEIIENWLLVIGKYSYAVFLVHHYIIMKVEATFQNSDLRLKGTVCLYLTVWLIIAIFSKILYSTNKNILSMFKSKENSKG